MNAVSYSQSKTVVLDITLILTFTFLMVISAFVRISLFFTPVPITMQTLVLFSSILILRNRAYMSQALYIFLGTVGLPVFCKGGAGLLYLLGPTGGYLLGFLAASIIAPFFMKGNVSVVKSFFVCVFSMVIVYFLGVTWLVFFHKFSFGTAFGAGVAPFITGDIFKIVLATGISTKLFGSSFRRGA
ncbi:MAG: biotin transporter BioY [Candidatus Omnitrophota bacterium]|nr:biotin transporter BioY [Candidatus Omnitrophota bacterium]